MSVETEKPMTVAELESSLLARDSSAVLVPPRILRRILRQSRSLTVFGQRVTRYTCTIDRDSLLSLADRYELGLNGDRGLPARLSLFARPETSWLQQQSRGKALQYYWRRLFQARLRVELARRRTVGLLSDAVIRERIFRLGPAAFDEARAVLLRMNILPATADQAETFIEFASIYLERSRFARPSLAHFFPGMPPVPDAEPLLAGDLDVNELLGRTRLEGAADPDVEEPEEPGAESAFARTLDDADLLRWPKDGSAPAATTEEKCGNTVRAAVRFWRQAGAKTGPEADHSRAMAFAEVDLLARRLRQALPLSEEDFHSWRQALAGLLPAASGPLWPAERRLLYDLQKVCLDQERDLFAVDLVEWVVTLGKKSVKRPLPHQASVRLVKHLRGAASRLMSRRISDEAQRDLRTLLHEALLRAEAGLRARFEPLLLGALEGVGLRPGSFAETVARDKLVAELLDRIVERGFLNMGDLRDAIARNRLKLPDLAGPIEMVRGDRLIRVNRRLALSLDGVYRRGEMYLRGLQRLSSLAFGTRLGRFLTLYFVLPVGGAFMLLEFLQHVVGPINHLVKDYFEIGLSKTGLGAIVGPGAYRIDPRKMHLLNQYSLPLTALLLFGLLYVPPCRRDMAAGLAATWRGLRSLFVELPRSLADLSLVRLLLGSPVFLWCWRWLGKPAVLALPWAGLAWLLGLGPEVYGTVGLAAFAVAFALVNTRLGLQVEEAVTEALSRGWLLVSADLVPGLFRLVVAFFRGVVEEVERFLYAVDEWFRFRSGDSQLSLVVKPILGLVWFAISYVVRFCIIILIEPQINPIKHFPVVTVSHKVMLSVGLPYMVKVLQLVPGAPHERDAIIALAGLIGSLIPGIFGFLAWELKENWRLYRANQQPNLQPEIVGHHGETLPRLLRSGFHSGTVPKLFARLRRTEGGRARSRMQALHDVADAVRRFADRGLAAVLAGSHRWGGEKFEVGNVELTTNRIRLELCCPNLAGRPVSLAFEEHAGWLAAGIEPSGTNWLASLRPGQSQALAAALAGFYKRAGVDLVRETLADNLPREALFAVTDRGLVAWPGPGFVNESNYLLGDDFELTPVPPNVPLTPLWANEVLFRNQPLPWTDWVLTWERDRAAHDHEPPLVAGMVLLPCPGGQKRLPGVSTPAAFSFQEASGAL